MSRKRTGSLEPWTDTEGRKHLRARIWLADKTRVRVPVPDGFSEARARDWAEHVQTLENEKGLLLAKKRKEQGLPASAPAQETWDLWLDRYLKWRSTKGYVTADATAARLKRYASPRLKGKVMVNISRDDIENIVCDLDARIENQEVRFTWKTAANVWGDVTCAFDEATTSKDRSLRVLSANPTRDVRGPERGDDREKPFLYPSELTALLSCSLVPFYWRRMYAVAAYTGARSNELAALHTSDVDFEHLKIHITKQVDRATGLARPTKTRRARSIDVEPSILPLLVVLAKEAGEGKLLRMPRDEDRAELLRKHLKVAGCTRPALEADDELRAPMKFHGLRDTCLSHMAVRGDDPLRIQWRAGHTQFATTQKYIEQARKVAGGFGTPFPAIPLAVIEPEIPRARGHIKGHLAAGILKNTVKTVATPMGIENSDGGMLPDNHVDSADDASPAVDP